MSEEMALQLAKNDKKKPESHQQLVDQIMVHYPELMPCGCEYEVNYSRFYY
jgi:hypothetical protein